MKESLSKSRRITHVGMGIAEVYEIAGNRRFTRPDGTISYRRMSRSADPEAQAGETGTIDPWLRTLSFWDGETPLCALHGYAVHPMSRYGAGKVSADFPGLARRQMQAAYPEVFQIYASGCSGNVVAGKWNTGGPDSTAKLAGKLKDAMERSWKASRKRPLHNPRFSLALMPLGARRTIAHTEAILRKRLAEGVTPFDRSDAAMGLAWYDRVKRGHQVQVPCLDLGPAQVLLLPGEAYVEFQLFAQSCRPDSWVFTLGYGECGPGYIPIERSWKEADTNLNDWAWTSPGSEAVMKKAIQEALVLPRK